MMALTLPKFVSALRVSKFSLLRFAQVVGEFDDAFLCICNYFCFAGIVVETNCTPLEVKFYIPHGRGNVCLQRVQLQQ